MVRHRRKLRALPSGPDIFDGFPIEELADIPPGAPDSGNTLWVQSLGASFRMVTDSSAAPLPPPTPPPTPPPDPQPPNPPDPDPPDPDDFGAEYSLGTMTDGWTDFPLHEDARRIYVSNGGSDSNDGLSPASPKLTIPAGYALVRDGFGDQLLLDRGSTFEWSGIWNRSGLSAEFPALLGAYGAGDRPIIDPGLVNAIVVSPGFASANTVRYVAFQSFVLYASQRDPDSPDFVPDAPTNNGFFILGQSTTGERVTDGGLIEDVRISYLGQGIAGVVSGDATSIGHYNWTIRRSVIDNTYAVGQHTNGIFLSRVIGVTVQELLIDAVQHEPLPDVNETSLSHTIYVQSDSRNVRIEDSVFTRAYDGTMQRPGGLYRRNLVGDVQVGHHQGYIFTADVTPTPGGIDAQVHDNAFTQLRDLSLGLQLGNMYEGHVSGNLILGPQNGISLIGSIGAAGNVGISNTVLDDNIVLTLNTGMNVFDVVFEAMTVSANRWQSVGRLISHAGDSIGDFDYSDDVYLSAFAEAEWFSLNGSLVSWPAWPAASGETGATTAATFDPTAVPTIADYNADVLGGARTLEGFLAGALVNNREAWDVDYTAAPVIAWMRGIVTP